MPTPEEIYEAAPKHTRPLPVDANVIAYFGDWIAATREGFCCQMKPPAKEAKIKFSVPRPDSSSTSSRSS